MYMKTHDHIPMVTNEMTDDYFYEFCRFSNSNFPPTNSIIGSVASQEIIKLITYKFYTINNTIICDGIHNTMSIFNL